MRSPGIPRRSFLALTGAALAGAVIGCDRAETRPNAAPLAKLRVGYFANATHAQAVLGVARGTLRSALGETALETRTFNAGPSLVEAILAEQLDLGYVGPWPALSGYLRSQGKGIRIVAGAAQNGVSIVARRGSGIRTLADLRDRRVATPQLGNTQDIAARHYLTKVLGQPTAKNVFPVANAEQVTLMLRGQLDAAWVPEPWGERLLREADAELIAEEKDLWPNKQFSLTVVVATTELVEAHPEVVRAVLGVHHDLTEELSTNPGGAAGELGAALQALTGQKLQGDALASALRRVQFSEEPSRETLETIARWAHELGFGDEDVDFERLIDRSFAVAG